MRALGTGDLVFLLMGLRWTVGLSLIAFLGGGLIGIAIALLRVSRHAPLSWFAIFYIRVFQGTPLLMQLFLVFFGGDLIGVPLGALLSACIGLSLNAGAFLGEIWRGAIQGVPRGQIEAARSLGLSYGAIMGKVVLPQALRLAVGRPG